MAEMKYSTEITLYNSYFDANDKLSLKAILSIFQDVASIHAEEIGVGYSDMKNNGLYWVLVRIKIDIKKMPSPNERVKVYTYPLEKGRIDFDRELRITSLGGETLITGVSKWCVIDTVTRALKRTDGVNYLGEYVKEKIYTEPFDKISFSDTNLEEAFSYKVNFADLDHNGHMNNTNYASLVSSLLNGAPFRHFEINFISECKKGDEIKVCIKRETDKTFVKGTVGEKISFISLTY